MSEINEQAGRKKGGCGKAIGVGCLAVVLLIAVGSFVAYQKFTKLADMIKTEFTAGEQVRLPVVEATDQEVAQLTARVGEFAKAVKEGQGGQELTLDSRSLNVLIQRHPAWTALSGKVCVELEGERIKGDASIPLDEVAKMFKGRWLNGSATFRVDMAAGRLLVFLDELSVRGKPVPDSFMAGIRAKNLAEEAAKKPESAALLEKLESVSVRDGKLIIKSK
jgi:hypothetical protein